MKQLVLLVLVLAAALAAPQPAADADAAQPAPPCDDGLAHIPNLPEGVRRPYSVRKRSRTVHHDQVAVTDDTPQLPPGQRRFDAVLPDEQGHDATSSTPARRARGQRRLSLHEDAVVNEVAAEPQDSEIPARRPARRPAARPKKLVVVEENYPVNHPAFAEHDAKADAVVDSYETVRRYPTHLPAEDGDDENLTNNDVLSVPAIDQVALEDVPTASTEERGIDNSVPAIEGDADLPPGYHSKFPKRTFASDAGGSGDVLRVKPRKRLNQYRAPQVPDEQDLSPSPQPEFVQDQRQVEPRPRPRPRPQAVYQPEEQQPVEDVDAAAPASPTGPGVSYRGAHRESHRVQVDGSVEPIQRRQPLRRRPVAAANPVTDEADAQQPVEPVQPRRQQPQRRRPRPRPTPADDAQVQTQQEQDQQEQRPAVRRRPRPRPAQQQQDDVQVASQDSQDITVHDNTVTPASQPSADEPQRRPLRRRARPRPRPVAVEEVDVSQDLDNTVQTTASPPVRRRRPQAAKSRTVSEESFQVQQTGSRGHGRRLESASAQQGLPQVQVEHDGSAKEGHEPTLVRSALKKVPEGAHPGDPSPALIQKIVKNTLKRLKPQIAEHEGDVKVDILVKVIQVEDRK